MNKRFLTIAIAASLAAPLMATAGNAKMYGRVHVSMDYIEMGGGADKFNAVTNPDAADAHIDLHDRKSAFGVKGKEDLGGGMTALFKAEWSFDPTDGGAIGTRDRWIGLKKAGMGTFKFGTMSSNYKMSAAKMDPFWHTAAEGRATGSASPLSGGAGDDGGRMTNSFQFVMAPISGMSMVFNTMLNGTGDVTTGLGLRYKKKNIYIFADYLKFGNDADVVDGLSDDDGYVSGEAATKFGIKYTLSKFTAGLTVEQTTDVTATTVGGTDGFNYVTLMAVYKLNSNDKIAFTYGMADSDGLAALDTNTTALGYMHSMSKRTSVYATYLDKSSDTEASEASGFTFGLKHKF